MKIALSILLLSFCTAAFGAATTATFISDFDSGVAGVVPTATTLGNGTHVTSAASGSWTVNGGSFGGGTFSGVYTNDHGGNYSVTVNGTTYNGPGAISYDSNNAVEQQGIVYILDVNYSALSFGLWMKVTCKVDDVSLMDLVALTSPISGQYLVVQMQDNTTAPTLKAHGNSASGATINIASYSNTWIWVTGLRTTSGTTEIALYDSSLVQIGSTSSFTTGSGDSGWIELGRRDVHPTDPATHTRYDSLIVDTTGTFPLMPGSAPAPPVVTLQTNNLGAGRYGAWTAR